ncbi:MAG: PCRF domain-containing protein, partial [Gammaproteobacteria bacterium]|nr:PCRF domain-containing protein [Gammaproteobacteria bacterium]
MKDSIRIKLQHLVERLDEVNALISEPDVINDQNKFRNLTKEHAQLSPVVEAFNAFETAEADLQEAKEMLASGDPDLKEMAQEELPLIEERLETLEVELQKML